MNYKDYLENVQRYDIEIAELYDKRSRAINDLKGSIDDIGQEMRNNRELLLCERENDKQGKIKSFTFYTFPSDIIKNIDGIFDKGGTANLSMNLKPTSFSSVKVKIEVMNWGNYENELFEIGE